MWENASPVANTIIQSHGGNTPMKTIGAATLICDINTTTNKAGLHKQVWNTG